MEPSSIAYLILTSQEKSFNSGLLMPPVRLHTSPYLEKLQNELTGIYTSLMTHMYFPCLDVRCLHSEFLCKNAPHWPWQWPTLASFPCSLPFLQPDVTGLIFGMLFMSELGGIPSCWMLGPISLKTQHQKWDAWKWLTWFSQEFRHFN